MIESRLVLTYLFIYPPGIFSVQHGAASSGPGRGRRRRAGGVPLPAHRQQQWQQDTHQVIPFTNSSTLHPPPAPSPRPLPIARFLLPYCCYKQCCGMWIRGIMVSHPNPHQIKIRIRIHINLQMTSQNVWNMSLFEHFFKGLS
jgi:hypothetical protein